MYTLQCDDAERARISVITDIILHVVVDLKETKVFKSTINMQQTTPPPW